jgi:hypothetical protein
MTKVNPECSSSLDEVNFRYLSTMVSGSVTLAKHIVALTRGGGAELRRRLTTPL